MYEFSGLITLSLFLVENIDWIGIDINTRYISQLTILRNSITLKYSHV